jgi:hypothetical protein
MADKPKKLTLEQITKKYGDLLSKIKGAKKDQFGMNIDNVLDEKNKTSNALKAYDYLHSEDVENLETDIGLLFDSKVKDLLTSFKVEKELDKYNFHGRKDATELTRELLGRFMGMAMEHYYLMKGQKDEAKKFAKMFADGKFTDEQAQDALRLIYGSRQEGVPDFIQWVKQVSGTFKGRRVDFTSKEVMEKIYGPLIGYATGHLDELRQKFKSYFITKKNDDEALKTVGGHLLDKLPKVPDKKIEIAPSATMEDRLGLLEQGYKVGFRAKAYGLLIEPHLKLPKGVEYEHLYEL